MPGTAKIDGTIGPHHTNYEAVGVCGHPMMEKFAHTTTQIILGSSLVRVSLSPWGSTINTHLSPASEEFLGSETKQHHQRGPPTTSSILFDCHAKLVTTKILPLFLFATQLPYPSLASLARGLTLTLALNLAIG